MMDDGSLGKGFWVKAAGILLGFGLAVLLSLLLISTVFVRWGLIGGLAVLSALLLFGAWLYDRREARREREANA